MSDGNVDCATCVQICASFLVELVLPILILKNKKCAKWQASSSSQWRNFLNQIKNCWVRAERTEKKRQKKIPTSQLE